MEGNFTIGDVHRRIGEKRGNEARKKGSATVLEWRRQCVYLLTRKKKVSEVSERERERERDENIWGGNE